MLNQIFGYEISRVADKGRATALLFLRLCNFGTRAQLN
jgi:hypothetical protein